LIARQIDESYRGKRVTITGGLGFIGSTLATRLVGAGAQVTLVDCELPDSGANRFNIAPIKDQVEIIASDIASAALIEPALVRTEYLFNLAGTLSHTDSMRDPAKDLHSNCTAHLSLLDSCRKLNPAIRILYAGTRGQYGRPLRSPVDESHPLHSADANGINKTAGESYHLLYARYYGLHTCSVRLSNAYGPRHQMKHARQGVLNWFVRRVLDGDPILIYGEGTQVRDTHYVDDVVDALLMTLASDASRGEAFNLGAHPLSLASVAKLLVELNGSGAIEYRPYPPDALGVEIGDYVADCSKIKKLVGWSPRVQPKEGFLKTLEYYREHKSQYW